MNDFRLYTEMGLFHVLDVKAYDHILFLIVLAVVFGFVDWKKVFWLVTLFTIGHSISLTLAAFEIIQIKVEIIEFLIPVTIFITGVTNIFNAKKISKTKDSVNLFFALFFGLIHGLGFSNYFRAMIGKEDDKLVPLAEFALGIEAAQVIIVLLIVSLGYILQNVAKVAKRDWILVTSSIVVGFSIQMMLDRVFW